MKIIKLLQQDDCAPDSLEHFEKMFYEETGLTILEFKDTSSLNGSLDILTWRLGDYFLSISADDPFYLLQKEGDLL